MSPLPPCAAPSQVLRAPGQQVALPTTSPLAQTGLPPRPGTTHLSSPHVLEDLLGVLCVGVGVAQLLLVYVLYCRDLVGCRRQWNGASLELHRSWSSLQGNAAAPLRPLPHVHPSHCSPHPAPLCGRSSERRKWGNSPSSPASTTLARVPPRSKALTSAPGSPAGAMDQHHQDNAGGQAAAQGPCSLLRGL